MRELRPEPVPIVGHPPAAEIAIREGETGGVSSVAVPRPPILDYPLGPVPDPGQTRLPSTLAAPATHACLEAFDRVMVLGSTWEALPRSPAAGPLLHDATADGQELELLRPLLEVPISGEARALADMADEPRAYQAEAVEKLLAHAAFLLADDAGTGKTVSACVALGSLFQARQARRALVISPKPARRHWSDHLARWSGGLVVRVVRGDRHSRDALWKSDAHVLLTDYQTLAEDIARGALADEWLSFDALVIDNLQGVSRRSAQVTDALLRIHAARRWGLAGAMPVEAAGWSAAFSLLLPGQDLTAVESGLPGMRERLLPLVLRRRKSDLISQMPRRTRQEIWLDLEESQAAAYREALAEERYRLSKLGGSATLTHIQAALERLHLACAFAPESLDGPKVRALVDLAEEVVPAGGKLVILSRYGEQVLDRLRPVLEAYGVARMSAVDPLPAQAAALELFRGRPDRRVLLADNRASGWGPLPVEASYVVHFDHDWNPAERWRVEEAMFPDVGPRPAVNLYEYWMAETVDERLHALLGERRLRMADVGQGLLPSELEGRLTVEDWLEHVLEVPRQRVVRRVEPESPSGTAFLPGTAVLRSQLAQLEPERFVAGVEMILEALGFGEAVLQRPVDETGGDIVAERTGSAGVERVLVRCLRTGRNVGVSEGRRLLKDLEARSDALGAYLVVTTDFTEALRKLADETDGRLSLISGTELYRHLHILGWL